jgi:phosphoglycerate dehydrogenase-like enzyme
MTNTPTILICNKIDDTVLARVRQAYPDSEIRVGPDIDNYKHTVDPRLMKGVDVLLCGIPPVNFNDFDCLKFIQLSSHGYSQVVGLPLIERGICVCNGLGTFDVPIAEWNIAMMVNLCRDLRGMIRNQEAGVWDPAERFQYEIFGSTVGFFGYGGLARATARLAKYLGMKIYAFDAQPIGPRTNYYVVAGTGDPEGKLPDKTFLPGQEMEFLRDLDFLIMTVPLTNKTRGIIGEEHLKALPRHAYLLNPARGPLIQEEALLKALREPWIAGAALDTHYHYPMPADHPLWRFPNVIMTPHISGSGGCQSYIPRVYDIFVQNLQRYCDGKPLLNELTESQLRGE